MRVLLRLNAFSQDGCMTNQSGATKGARAAARIREVAFAAMR